MVSRKAHAPSTGSDKALNNKTFGKEFWSYIGLAVLAILALGGAMSRFDRRIEWGRTMFLESQRPPAKDLYASLMLNGQPLRLEMARTPEAHYQGLSDRPSMCPECGMLFIFPKAEPREFVMRRMQFPLDMVWIADGKVVDIDYNAQPESGEPYTLYSADQAVDRVLEINAGAAARYGLRIGDAIKLPD